MSTLREQVVQEYIDKNYPNAKIVNYTDKESGLEFYTSDELQEVTADWFPLCCYKDEKTGKVVYGGRPKVIHTYTEGETGSGKTTRFVMQSIRALSSLKEKPSFFIVDIHGEIIENLYSHLKENGYDVKVLNCDNPSRSDTYNPFWVIAKECLESKCLSNDVITKIRRIAELIQPIEGKQDPVWDRGARSYTNGAILDKFEDLINGDIPLDCLTIYNVIENHHWIREMINDQFGFNLLTLPHYRKKGTRSLSVQKMISVTNNADKTRASYFGVIENHYDTFGQPTMYALSSNNTINIPDMIEKPTAIVIQSGNTTIGDDLISLLVNDIYYYVVKTGKNSPTKMLSRKIHCFLDEFANCNIADGPEFIRMLTTSRKFGMYWHLFLQCDAQLDRKYDPDIGKIIRSNCTEIFMGSQDYGTMERFAHSCGHKTIESLESSSVMKMPDLKIVSLITPETLNVTEDGYVYVKANRFHLLKSYFEAFYNCPEFKKMEKQDDVYPYNNFDYTQTAFFPSNLYDLQSHEEFEVLKYIYLGINTADKINELFSNKVKVEGILSNLVNKKLIAKEGNNSYKCLISKSHFDILAERDQRDVYKEYKPPVIDRTQRSPSFEDIFEECDDEEEEKVEDASDKKAPINKISMFVVLHFSELSEDFDFSVRNEVTCIPLFLQNMIKRHLKEDIKDEVGSDFIPSNLNLLKFEILEEFIRNNAFDTKEEWDERFSEEYEKLEESGIFPKSIVETYENALKEFKEDLTLDNINEIKKILSQNG